MGSVHGAVVRRGLRLLTAVTLAGFALLVVLGSGSVRPGGGAARAARSAPVRAVSSQPVTLVSTKGAIEGFAQDGGWIVWAEANAPCQQQVKIRGASGGVVRSLLSRGGATCKADDSEGYQSSMALAGTRALWAALGESGNTFWDASVRTSSLTTPLDRELISLSMDIEQCGAWCRWSVPVAGDGSTLLFVNTNNATEDYRYGGAQVYRVGADGRKTALPRTTGTWALSASRAWFAAARETRGWRGIEVRNALTGATRLQLTVKGRTWAVALTPTRLAILVQQGATWRIRVYSLAGTLQRSVAVPPSIADELERGDVPLAAAGRWVVYHTDKTIRALDLRSGRTSVLTVAKLSSPVGLSLEGRRLAWVESWFKESRIRALTLPR